MSLLADADTFHETVRQKLKGLLTGAQGVNFDLCGRDKLFVICRGCEERREMEVRCNLKWCPRCNWRRTEERKKVLGAYCSKIEQPKHLVLTERNWSVMTKERLIDFNRRLVKMRDRKSFAAVRGGCVSTEVTWEGKGFHPHSHWLLDVDWLDMPSVAADWASLCGQEFAICKVKDVRGADYLREVCKYVVTGSELARWPGHVIAEFVTAVKGVRFFKPFGDLYKRQAEVKRELNANRPPGRICACGCEDFRVEGETTALLRDLQANVTSGRAPSAKASERRKKRLDDIRRRANQDYLAGTLESKIWPD